MRPIPRVTLLNSRKGFPTRQQEGGRVSQLDFPPESRLWLPEIRGVRPLYSYPNIDPPWISNALT